MKKILTATGIAALLGVTLAWAAAPDFAAVDVNGDLALTYEELSAAMPDLTQDAFLAADTNADGVLDAEEYAAMTS